MLVLIAGALGWLVYRRLVRPLSATMSDDALALQVEAANKQLGQSLISALQLARMDDVESRGMSPRARARRRSLRHAGRRARQLSPASSTAASSGSTRCCWRSPWPCSAALGVRQ